MEGADAAPAATPGLGKGKGIGKKGKKAALPAAEGDAAAPTTGTPPDGAATAATVSTEDGASSSLKGGKKKGLGKKSAGPPPEGESATPAASGDAQTTGAGDQPAATAPADGTNAIPSEAAPADAGGKAKGKGALGKGGAAKGLTASASASATTSGSTGFQSSTSGLGMKGGKYGAPVIDLEETAGKLQERFEEVFASKSDADRVKKELETQRARLEAQKRALEAQTSQLRQVQSFETKEENWRQRLQAVQQRLDAVTARVHHEAGDAYAQRLFEDKLEDHRRFYEFLEETVPKIVLLSRLDLKLGSLEQAESAEDLARQLKAQEDARRESAARAERGDGDDDEFDEDGNLIKPATAYMTVEERAALREERRQRAGENFGFGSSAARGDLVPGLKKWKPKSTSPKSLIVHSSGRSFRSHFPTHRIDQPTRVRLAHEQAQRDHRERLIQARKEAFEALPRRAQLEQLAVEEERSKRREERLAGLRSPRSRSNSPPRDSAAEQSQEQLSAAPAARSQLDQYIARADRTGALAFGSPVVREITEQSQERHKQRMQKPSGQSHYDLMLQRYVPKSPSQRKTSKKVQPEGRVPQHLLEAKHVATHPLLAKDKPDPTKAGAVAKTVSTITTHPPDAPVTRLTASGRTRGFDRSQERKISLQETHVSNAKDKIAKQVEKHAAQSLRGPDAIRYSTAHSERAPSAVDRVSVGSRKSIPKAAIRDTLNRTASGSRVERMKVPGSTADTSSGPSQANRSSGDVLPTTTTAQNKQVPLRTSREASLRGSGTASNGGDARSGYAQSELAVSSLGRRTSEPYGGSRKQTPQPSTYQDGAISDEAAVSEERETIVREDPYASQDELMTLVNKVDFLTIPDEEVPGSPLGGSVGFVNEAGEVEVHPDFGDSPDGADMKMVPVKTSQQSASQVLGLGPGLELSEVVAASSLGGRTSKDAGSSVQRMSSSKAASNETAEFDGTTEDVFGEYMLQARNEARQSMAPQLAPQEEKDFRAQARSSRKSQRVSAVALPTGKRRSVSTAGQPQLTEQEQMLNAVAENVVSAAGDAAFYRPTENLEDQEDTDELDRVGKKGPPPAFYKTGDESAALNKMAGDVLQSAISGAKRRDSSRNNKTSVYEKKFAHRDVNPRRSSRTEGQLANGQKWKETVRQSAATATGSRDEVSAVVNRLSRVSTTSSNAKPGGEMKKDNMALDAYVAERSKSPAARAADSVREPSGRQSKTLGDFLEYRKKTPRSGSVSADRAAATSTGDNRSVTPVDRFRAGIRKVENQIKLRVLAKHNQAYDYKREAGVARVAAVAHHHEISHEREKITHVKTDRVERRLSNSTPDHVVDALVAGDQDALHNTVDRRSRGPPRMKAAVNKVKQMLTLTGPRSTHWQAEDHDKGHKAPALTSSASVIAQNFSRASAAAKAPAGTASIVRTSGFNGRGGSASFGSAAPKQGGDAPPMDREEAPVKAVEREAADPLELAADMKANKVAAASGDRTSFGMSGGKASEILSAEDTAAMQALFEKRQNKVLSARAADAGDGSAYIAGPSQDVILAPPSDAISFMPAARATAPTPQPAPTPLVDARTVSGSGGAASIALSNNTGAGGLRNTAAASVVQTGRALAAGAEGEDQPARASRAPRRRETRHPQTLSSQ
ncbi:unnamed protein product [Amoebophrya sp. A120]|nr:unnamed protein product [Amoebophrya sp. A120]|eukprot:GSA120T00005045001.1